MAKKKTTLIPDALPIAIISADLHITATPWKHRQEIRGDAASALQQIRKACRMFRPEGYLDEIIAGDIMDSKTPTRQDLAILSHQKFTKYHYILGNHDVDTPSYPELFHAGNSTNLEEWIVGVDYEFQNVLLPYSSHQPDAETLHKGVVTLKAEPLDKWKELLIETGRFDSTFNLEGKLVFGINYRNSREALTKAINELEEAATKIKPDVLENSILVLHQNCDKLFPLGEPELVDGMLPDFRFVICGHYHKPMFNTILSKTGKPIPLLSPGSVYPTDIADTEPKYIYLLLSTGELMTIPLETRKIFTFETKGEKNIAKLTKKFNEVIEKYSKEYKCADKDRARPYPLLHIKYDEEFQSQFDTIVTPTIQALFDDEKYPHIHKDFFFYTMIRKGQEAATADIDPTISLTTNFESIRSTFKELEPDAEVRQIVETMFTSDSTPETYQQLKTLST
jgi:predicted phosphodiesterase